MQKVGMAHFKAKHKKNIYSYIIKYIFLNASRIWVCIRPLMFIVQVKIGKASRRSHSLKTDKFIVGFAKLWLESHVVHLPARTWAWECGLVFWAPGDSFPGSLEEHAMGPELILQVNFDFQNDLRWLCIFFFITVFYMSIIYFYYFRGDVAVPGYHGSLYHAIQSLKDNEFSTFHDHIKYARQVVVHLASHCW